jgi:hypothetical protein
MSNIKFMGDGFIQGVPARDLTQAEFDEFDEETRALILSSQLYKIIIDKPVKPVKKDGE